MKTKHFSCLLAGLIFAGVAQAQQVVSYFAEIPQLSTDWTQTLQLPGFDASLGTLTQVKLSYSAEVWQSVFGENMNDTGSTYDLSTTATLTLGKLGGPSLFAPPPVTLQRSGIVEAFDGTLDFAEGSGVQFSQNFSVSGIYLDSDLVAYIGADPIDFAASASGIASLNTGANFAKGASTSALASLSVEYSYTPIPEPATYAAILGTAALALASLRRRRAGSLN